MIPRILPRSAEHDLLTFETICFTFFIFSTHVLVGTLQTCVSSFDV